MNDDTADILDDAIATEASEKPAPAHKKARKKRAKSSAKSSAKAATSATEARIVVVRSLRMER